MTEVLSGSGQFLSRRQASHQMPDRKDEQWRQQQYYNEVMAGTWTGAQPTLLTGIPGVDLRMYPRNDTAFVPLYNGPQDQMISPSVGYGPDAWTSDMEMGTPSTTGFPGELGETFSNPPQPQPVPIQYTDKHRGSVALQGEAVGLHLPPPSASVRPVERPTLNRSTTAPEQREKISDATGKQAAASKRGSASDEEDEEFVPANEDTKTRGRKRQRVPHTAVERRYRENLNAHLDKLRQTVPALASRRPSGVDKDGGGTDGGGGGAEGVKPSKCEILNGAIEHIGVLGRENLALKNEVQTLRAKMFEMQARYSAIER